MNREEAEEHFWKNHAKEVCQKALAQTDQYYRQHKEQLAQEFASVFMAYCQKIRQAQDQGKKEKIRHIFYSLLYSSLIGAEPLWRIDAYNRNLYLDKQECSFTYDTPWLFKPLHDACQGLDQARKKYVGQIGPEYIDKIKRREAHKYIVYVVLTARRALQQASLSPEFAAMDKRKILDVWVGEYRDRNKVVHSYDIRKKDPEKIKKWLEEKKEQQYYCIVIKDLDLSDGDYSNLEFSYSDLSGCIFKNVEMSNNYFYGTNLSRCIIEDSTFYNSNINGASFENAVIRRTSFNFVEGQEDNIYYNEDEDEDEDDDDYEDEDENEGDYAEDYDEENDDDNDDEEESEEESEDDEREPKLVSILDGVTFENSTLEDVEFDESRLENANFSGAKLSRVSFFSSCMEGVNFTNAILTDCDFSYCDLNDSCFAGSIISGCDFQEAELEGAFFANELELDHIGLSPEQQEQVVPEKRSIV